MTDDPRVTDRAIPPLHAGQETSVVLPAVVDVLALVLATPEAERGVMVNHAQQWLDGDRRRWHAVLAVAVVALEYAEVPPGWMNEWATELRSDGHDDA